MDTLINVDNRRGGSFSSSARSFSCTLSSTTGTGVSVENVPEETVCWYVLRVSYHQELKANEWLQDKNVETYLPLHYEERESNGRRKRVKVPLLPNLIFVHLSFRDLEVLMKSQDGNLLTYYYDHFQALPDGKNPPLTVPDKQMDNFIRLTSIDNDHILFVPREKCHFKNGDIVIVTGGLFLGIKGRIARVNHQQRVVVEVEGVGCLTTAYVSSRLIRTWDNVFMDK